MKLYSAPRAPYPRRVLMFMREKGIHDIEIVDLDLMAGEQRSAAYLRKNPLGQVPALELDDGRVLSEARAICTYLEYLHPEPALMGDSREEFAFIEMHDRRVELQWMVPIFNWARHSLPALAPLVRPQLPEFGAWQGEEMLKGTRWVEELLGRQPWIAGDRFTIADITAFCSIEMARVMKFHPGEQGFAAIQAWRDKVAARESARPGQ